MKFDKKKAIKQKNIIQEKAVKLLYSYRRILLSWATGCGKTLASLKIIEEYLKHFPESKGYVICKEINHLSNWVDDITKHKKDFILDKSHMFLYDSLHKHTSNGYVDFIILDECHAINENRANKLNKIIGPDTLVIMLSATVEPKKSIPIRNLLKTYKEYKITIDKAISMEILPYPKVKVHLIELNNKDRLEYDTVSDIINILGEKYDKTGKEWDKIKWVNKGSERKRMIAGFKTEFARKLIGKQFKDSRFICFTGSKEQCEELNRHNFVHSGKSKKRNLKKKEAFNAGRINNLFVVNMFREAMNLENIEKGLIVQLDSGKLSFIQMLGRVFRSNLPEMHILVLKDTQDEKYLNNVMKGFNKEYVEYINYDNRIKTKI